MSFGPGTPPAAEVGAAGSASFVTRGALPAAASADFWSQLVAAQTSDQLCRAWLGILCQWIPGTNDGLLLLHEQGDTFAPAAVWPDPERDLSHLGEVAQQALVERRGVVAADPAGSTRCAYPLLTADQAFGVVVLVVANRGDAALRDALRLLHWGAGWLVGLFDKRDLLAADLRSRRSALLQDLLLGTLAETRDDDAARWLVNRLVEGLPCRQAILSSLEGSSLVPKAVSGTAGFEARAGLIAAATQAMESALAQRRELRWPVADGAIEAEASGEPAAGANGSKGSGRPSLTGPSASDLQSHGESRRDHEPEDREFDPTAADALGDYTRAADAAAAIAVPLFHGGRAIGALLVDWSEPPPAESLAFAAIAGAAAAPALALQRRAGRGLFAHARESTAAGWRDLTGPRHAGAKALVLLAVLLLGLAAVVDIDDQIRAPATIEGRVQRAAVAPFDGFVAAAPVRAGDRVRAGEVLARLDDRDLRLDQARSRADAELAERRLRDAMARADAVAMRVAQAERDQAQAELALVRERLARAAITAPFDGIVVRGDLSQQLGAPVETGRVLFEIAPLDAWRVVLQVDERDIVRVRTSQPAELALAGLPGVHHELRIARISPVALAEDGRTSFRVEAEVAGTTTAMIQPGMEGVARITAGRRSILWLGFHRIADWLRYTAWSLGL